jgi:hypothetical protein
VKTRACWVVVDVQPRSGVTPLVKRVTRHWPSLQPGEVAFKVAFELPEELVRQQITTAEVEALGALVAVVQEVPEPEPDDALVES